MFGNKILHCVGVLEFQQVSCASSRLLLVYFLFSATMPKRREEKRREEKGREGKGRGRQASERKIGEREREI